MRQVIGGIGVLLAVAAWGCGGEPEQSEMMPEPPPAESADPGREVATDYAADLDVDLAAMERTPSGLLVQELAEGEGDPVQPGDRVFVHYTGWLPDGTQFDSSRNRGQPIDFVLGQGQVVDGWDEGIDGMRPGGRRRLVIPPALGYGEGGRGPIPPNSTMVFEVELVSVGGGS